jgi:hypothetical protein
LFLLTVAQEIRPSASETYVIQADYAWQQADANIDDLILMTGEIHHETLDRGLFDGGREFARDITALKAVVDVKNFTQGTTLRQFLISDTDALYVPRLFSGTPPAATYVSVPANRIVHRAMGHFLAVDLRVLAFVVQQKLTRFTAIPNALGVYPAVNAPNPWTFRFRGSADFENESTVRVQVFMKNVLEQEKILDPEASLLQKLQDMFSDLDVGGKYRLPFNEQASLTNEPLPFFGPSPYTSPRTAAYAPLRVSENALMFLETLGDPRFVQVADGADVGFPQSFYANYKLSNTSFGGFWGDRLGVMYNASAYLYAVCIGGSMKINSHDVFCVHPDGRWSIVTAPFFHYSGVHNSRAPLSAFDVTLMKQDFVDIINLRRQDRETGEQVDARTTHVEAINLALEEAYTREDFMYKFSVDVFRASNFDRYAAIVEGATDDLGVFVLGGIRVSNPDGLPTQATESWSHIDARTARIGFMPSAANNFFVLRGNALFY